jgi:hypothetical protein
MVWQVQFRASNAGERFRQRSSYRPLRFSLLWLLGVDVIGRPLHLDELDWRLWLIAQTAPPHNNEIEKTRSNSIFDNDTTHHVNTC